MDKAKIIDLDKRIDAILEESLDILNQAARQGVRVKPETALDYSFFFTNYEGKDFVFTGLKVKDEYVIVLGLDPLEHTEEEIFIGNIPYGDRLNFISYLATIMQYDLSTSRF